MIPLRDNIPVRHTPLFTLAIIALNAYVFLQTFLLGAYGGERFIHYYGLIPCSLTGACRVVGRAFSSDLTVVTSMFVHAGFFHFAGNMLYLWIFGNNVEDALGRLRFVVFYLLCGLAAALAQILMDPVSRIPMVGASGAISGVLGAYVVLFPRARILTLVPLGLFTQLVEIPAVIVLGFWIVVQLLNGFLTFNFSGGGVAWFAHVGGFLTGLLLVQLFRQRPRPYQWGKRAGFGF